MGRFIPEHDGGKIKPAGYKHEYTDHELMELIRCADDVKYFIKTYIKIIHPVRGSIPFDLYDFQERLLDNYVSHNKVICMLPRQVGKTQTSAAYIVHQSIFKDDQTIIIAANKGKSAKEVMDRIRDMYMELPWFIKPGVTVNNVFELKFDNGSRILAETTTPDTGRGKSCVTGDTRIVISNEYDDVFHTSIDKINSSASNAKIYHCVYEITNIVNNKIYVGYHKTKNLDDGYMGSGKLIKKAIAKYGIENFKKHYIEIFDNIEDALALEAEIVDASFCQRDDTYNICTGGQIRAMPGKSNPFYGKKHSPEVCKMISNLHTGNTYTSIEVVYDGIKYYSFKALYDKGISRTRLFDRIDSDAHPDTYVVDVEIHNKIKESVKKRHSQIIANKKRLRELVSNRFKDVPKSEGHKQKIAMAHLGTTKPWVADKINRNPDKIKKTAEKHRVMKRSETTKLNMSMARRGKPSCTKNTKWYHNPDTLEERMLKKNQHVPGFVLGKLPKRHHNKGKKYYNNPDTGKNRLFSLTDDIPNGFVKGLYKCKS